MAKRLRYDEKYLWLRYLNFTADNLIWKGWGIYKYVHIFLVII